MENKLILGDNLQVLKSLPSESVGLIYLDPPFFSNRNYEVIWGDEGEVRSFKDRWEGGINHYISWLKERVVEMHRILKKTGSIYLHCDWHADAYIRVHILDPIFVENGGRFLNEIIWRYRTYEGNVSKYFPKKHDTIYLYSKSLKYTFNTLKEGNFEDNIDFKRWGRFLQNSNEIRGDNYPKTDSRFNALFKKWQRENEGKIPTKGDIIYKLEGFTVDTVWEIKAVDPKDKRERIGYPTQKPEALLERIIKASSNEGDIVLDPFVGGGTTPSVADKLGRRWIGIDSSVHAIKVSEQRIKNNQIKK